MGKVNTKIQDMDVKGKIVVLRCDFNVPIENGKILDDSKIKASLETIEYLQDKDCKIVLLSHLGNIKSEEDKLKNSLQPVAIRLSELLDMTVGFSKQTRSIPLWEKVRAMQSGDIILLENTRFEDFPKKLESKIDTQLAMYWASLGDIFINDAFGSLHRVHTSTAGIAKHIPSGIGFLVQKELENLDNHVLNAAKPFTVIMGGSKVEDKLLLIERLLPKCDNLLLGGRLANAFLDALGFESGFSNISYDRDLLEKLKVLMLDNKEKIMLPLDAVVSSSYDSSVAMYRLIDKIDPNDLIYDIGARTIEKYKTAITESATVFMNGTVGLYEDRRFANGTKEILNLVANSEATTIIGGGDAVSASYRFGFADKMTYISSGGGASLEYIAKRKLPVLDYIDGEEEPYEILEI